MTKLGLLRSSLILVAVGVVGTLLLLTFAYMLGMRYLEGESRTVWQSLEWAAETLTTTGYGRDAVWTHPAMVVFVVIAQFGGVVLIFMLIPFILVPVLEQRFESKLPRAATGLNGHLVVYGYGPEVTGLLADAEDFGIETVVIEARESEARRLFEAGQTVVSGQLDGGVLERVSLGSARAVVGNGSDEENSELIVSARQAGFEGPIVALVEHPFHRKPLLLAGATAAITPRHALGAALAALASRKISPAVSGIQSLGGRLTVSELRIAHTSPLAGMTLQEAGLRERSGVTVLGLWVAGALLPSPRPDQRLDAGSIVVAAGSHESLQRLDELCHGGVQSPREGHFVIAGYGEVGQKVNQLLEDAGESTLVVDRQARDGVDLVGDYLDPDIFKRARIDRSGCVVLALDNDTSAFLGTLMIRDATSDVMVVARVNRRRNVDRMHRAGADFALALGQVSGQILAGQLLGEQAIGLSPGLKLLKVTEADLAKRSVGELGIREQTGCSVVAVERSGEVLVDIGPGFEFQAGDVPYVCGSGEATRAFQQKYCPS